MDDDDLQLFSTEDLEKLLSKAKDALRIMKASVDQLMPHDMPASKLLHIEDLKAKIARYQAEIASRPSGSPDVCAKPRLTHASVDALLYKMLCTDSDFDAFCMDALPNNSHRRFGSSADRQAKHNLLMQLLEPEQVAEALRQYNPERFTRFASLLKYRSL